MNIETLPRLLTLEERDGVKDLTLTLEELSSLRSDHQRFYLKAHPDIVPSHDLTLEAIDNLPLEVRKVYMERHPELYKQSLRNGGR